MTGSKNKRYRFKKLLISIIIFCFVGQPAFISLSAAPPSPSPWATVHIMEAIQKGIVPVSLQKNYQEDISRQEFVELIIQIFEQATQIEISYDKNLNPFSDTNHPAVIKAYQFGMVVGTGDGKFTPDRNIYRGEIAYLFYSLLNWFEAMEPASGDHLVQFADYAIVKEYYAYDTLNHMVSMGIISGMDNKIAPYYWATREQAILMGSRVYDQIRGAMTPQNQPALIVAGKTLRLWEKETNIIQKFGQPNRKDPTAYGFDWYVYNQDYNYFLMIGIGNGMVQSYFTNSPYFVFDGKWRPGSGQANEESYGKGLHFIYDTAGSGKLAGIYNLGLSYFDPYRYEHNMDAIQKGDERALMDCTNSFRVANGKKTLQYNENVADIARRHSADMAEQGYFGHLDLNGRSALHRFGKAAERYSVAGENLSGGPANALLSFERLMQSTTHRENMLQDIYTHGGTGVYYKKDSDYIFYYTQNFVAY